MEKVLEMKYIDINCDMGESFGAYTTVQDRGRFGYVHMGVPISGARDIRGTRRICLHLRQPAGGKYAGQSCS